jgi:GTP-binding protein YchF
MKLKIGLLGLPNVGKSSLFNGLARKSLSLAANYPFATIEPHRAIVPTPDDYLDPLSRFADSVTTVPATMEWVDVAGLAKGAHRGEGLGNQFLGTLRQCSALCHVVRMFEDPNVIHVDGVVDPAGDADVIMLELLFADMEHVQRRLEKINVPPDERSVLERILKGLEQGEPARSLELTSDEELSIRSMGLLTLKPVMYALNIDEVDFTVGREEAVAAASEFIKRLSFANGAQQPVWALVSAKIEAELAKRDMEEQSSYFTSLGADAALAERLSYRTLPLAAKHLLKQKTFYTGPGVPAEKSRTCKSHLFSSISALQLANRLHGDIGKGFICAEVTPAPILLNYINYNAAKEAGVVRMEGKQYEVQECDVVLIRWKG